MSQHPTSRLAVLSFVAMASLSLPAQAADRLVRSIEESQTVVLAGSVHPRSRPETDIGPLDTERVLEGMSFVFALSPSQKADLKALLSAQADPNSPLYAHFLTPEEYADRFGMSDSDLGRVSDWLAGNGFRVDGVSRSKTRLNFTGTVGKVNAVFRTEMRRFQTGSEAHFANATPLSLPADLAGVMLSVEHLNDFRPHSRILRRPVSPNFTSQLSGSTYMTPEDFATIYDVAPLYAAGIDGSGQIIAIVGQTQVSTTDIAAFRSASGLSAINLATTLVPASGSSAVSTADVDEASLDIEWSSAVARNAQIAFVYVGNDARFSVWDALQYAVEQRVAPIISTSYGYCEPQFGATATAQLQQLMQQANTQGQTVVAAAGDAGAADCDTTDKPAAVMGLAVDLPASIPEVTGVGGTEFSGDVENVSTYWNSTNDGLNGSARSYIPETVWNDTAAEGALAATGGGVSSVFAKPTWQSNTTLPVPPGSKREVPDVSFSASPAHDPYIICSQGSCAGDPSDTNANDGQGYRANQGNLDVVGGTSAGAPTFAGALALVRQYTNTSGGLGNVNPTLYQLAVSAPGAFHQITTGNNIVPCTAGTTGCPSSPPYQYGYSAAAGYNLATGLGSLDVFALATAWPSASAPRFALGSPSPASLTLTSGGSEASSLSIAALNGFTGTVSFSCQGAPFNCAFEPSTVTLSSATPSGTTTITVNDPGVVQAAMVGWGTGPTTGLFAVIGLLFVAGRNRSRKGPKRHFFATAAVALSCLAGTSCGGGSHSSPAQSKVTPGTYSLSVVATGTVGTSPVTRGTTISVLVE